LQAGGRPTPQQAAEKASSLKEHGRSQKAEGELLICRAFLGRFCLLPCAFAFRLLAFSSLLRASR
jgi:hypothetical protein